MLVLDVGGHFTRIAFTTAVWPASRELLQIGQYVAVNGITDSDPFIFGSDQFATEIRLCAETWN